jgi:acetyl-CoA carboxylase biotin carboxyl carrier protein
MAQGTGRQRTGRRGGTAQGAGAETNGRSEATSGVAQHMIDLEFLRGLIEAVDRSGIDSLEINRAGTRIRIAKTPPPPPAPQVAFPAAAGAAGTAPATTVLHTVPAPAAPAPAAGGGTVAPAAPATGSNLVDVKSPMVGTFYRAPAPDAPPYVELGSHVTRGQTLCILEAMKLMNELECEVDGVIREILVEDADPVEFGQVLYRIEPVGSK